MARNAEKNLTALNRLHLQKEAQKNKKETRPLLSRMNSAEEIRYWIPSIKTEISFCIRHLSGIRNYPHYKIREFEERLANLKKEYKRFVSKCTALDPHSAVLANPGDPHAYISKKKLQQQRELFNPDDTSDNRLMHQYDEELEEYSHKTKRIRLSESIPTPLLDTILQQHNTNDAEGNDNEENEEDNNDYNNTNSHSQPATYYCPVLWDTNDHTSDLPHNQPLFEKDVYQKQKVHQTNNTKWSPIDQSQSLKSLYDMKDANQTQPSTTVDKSNTSTCVNSEGLSLVSGYDTE